ncbi:MAG TPA: thioredoxin domain-containing protein [Pyrinomonadaceae bacterium]|nr:thioredoxin domain-containing protein [Pyrinomonadaceae bacterium]
MLFRSSPGRVLFLILLLRLTAFAQAPETVLATVNGTGITLKQVDETVLSAINPLQQQLYAIRKVALDNLIITKLLETEARAQGVSVEELRQRLTRGEISGEIKVTRAQVEEAYAQNASFFASMSPDEARERLRLDLENQSRMKHYRAGVEALKKKWPVVVTLPSAPVGSELDFGMSPVKGAQKAAVTIVEFSDFECPFCAQVQETLRQVMERYGSEVRLVFKHLPSEGHRNSLMAARAAYCAGEQDRFWQFHDALFASRNLSREFLNETAVTLGLGRETFAGCLASERSRTAVVKDIEMARRYRIDGTPSFLINGKLVRGALTFAEFSNLIERELQQFVTRKTASTN